MLVLNLLDYRWGSFAPWSLYSVAHQEALFRSMRRAWTGMHAFTRAIVLHCSVLGPGMLTAIDEAAKLVKREARVVPGSVKVTGRMTSLRLTDVLLYLRSSKLLTTVSHTYHRRQDCIIASADTHLHLGKLLCRS